MPIIEKSTIAVTKSIVIASLALSAVLVAACALLLYQNWELRASLQAAMSRAYAPEVGTTLIPLQGRDIHGNPVLFDYSGESRPTLLLVFSPTCGVCDENWPNWRTLRTLLPADRARIIGVDLSSQADLHYFSRHGLDESSVISTVDPKCIVAHKFRRVPQTLLVDAEGTLIKAYFGLLTDEDLAAIQGFVVPDATG